MDLSEMMRAKGYEAGRALGEGYLSGVWIEGFVAGLTTVVAIGIIVSLAIAMRKGSTWNPH